MNAQSNLNVTSQIFDSKVQYKTIHQKLLYVVHLVCDVFPHNFPLERGNGSGFLGVKCARTAGLSKSKIDLWKI